MTKLATLLLPLALLACNNGDKDPVEPTDTDTTPTETDAPTDTDTEPADTETTEGDPTVVEAVIGTDRFSILEAAVIKADLAGALTGVTVFAPNDDAFNALFTAIGVGGVDDLSVDQITAILTYHVLAGEVDADGAIAAAGTNVTALGGSLAVAYDDASSTLTIDDATVIAPNIMAADGIIHEIDSVLVPSITDVVSTDPTLSTLFAAIGAVDADDSNPMLGSTLDGEGSFTLLAPTDTAFTTFIEANDSLNGLGDVVTALGVDGVVGVLQYHVIADTVLAETVVTLDGSSASSLNGTITVTVDNGSVILNDGVDGGFPGTNDATVVVTDILTSNGAIHKIDRVILPAD